MSIRCSVVTRTWIWIAVALAAGAMTGVVSARRLPAPAGVEATARFSAMP
jgi:hypothetical protein